MKRADSVHIPKRGFAIEALGPVLYEVAVGYQLRLPVQLNKPWGFGDLDIPLLSLLLPELVEFGG